ncbi:MAG: hypothetical protein RLZZ399_594, partial [Verrucomicrobiota bacterium]
EPLPKSSVPWPEENPFPLIRARLCVYYHLRAARWFQPCFRCEQPAHPISHTGIWYRCLRCHSAFRGSDHEFYFDWQIFLSHHDQQLVQEYYRRTHEALLNPSPNDSSNISPESGRNVPLSPWEASALEDFCFAAILSDPSMLIPLPQTYSVPFEKGRAGEPKPRKSPSRALGQKPIDPPRREPREGTL